MRRFIFLICVLQLPFFLSFGTEVAQPSKSYAVVIGYADDSSIQQASDLFRRKRYFFIAERSENAIRQLLRENGFLESHKGIFKKSNQFSVTLINANIQCENESSFCQEQQNHSEHIVEHFKKNIGNYDGFFYIGHSRQGMGLGLGPFIPEFTLPIEIYNEIEQGKLKTVVMASCESNQLYKAKFSYLNGIKFVGTDEKLMWTKDLLPLLLNQIKKSILE